MNITELIEQSKVAREIHVLWQVKQQDQLNEGKQLIANVGDVEHHKKWIKYYDEIIEVLEKIRS